MNELSTNHTRIDSDSIRYVSEVVTDISKSAFENGVITNRNVVLVILSIGVVLYLITH